jgi:hypothetical protein
VVIVQLAPPFAGHFCFIVEQFLRLTLRRYVGADPAAFSSNTVAHAAFADLPLAGRPLPLASERSGR